MKKWLSRLFITGAIIIGATNVPILPTQMKWVVSYETAKFDSADGDLPKDGYAVREDGMAMYVWRTTDTVENCTPAVDDFSQPICTTSEVKRKEQKGNFDTVPLTYDVSKLTEYHVIGKAYYDQFVGVKGDVIRVPTQQTKYKRLGTVPNEPIPEKTELVSITSPTTVSASIARDAFTNTRNSSGSSFSFSHTSTGSNLVMSGMTTAQDGSHANYPVTSFTYNSVSLTKIRSDEPVGNVRSESWYLIAPATGTNTVAITFTGALGEVSVSIWTMTGAKQSAQPDAQVGASGTSAAPQTGALTTVADDTFVTAVVTAEAASQAPNVLITDAVNTDQSFENARYMSGFMGKAGATRLGVSLSSSQPYAITAVSFSPATDDRTAHESFYQVYQSSDDGEENTSGTTNAINSSDLELINDTAVGQVGVRFSDVFMHSSPTIASSSLWFQTDEIQTGTDTVTIYGEKANDSATFSTGAADISGRTKTTASVSWAMNSTSCSTVDDTCISPDVSSIIQEIVNQAGWASGNAITFIFTGADTNRRTLESWDGENGGATGLHIEYTTAAASSGTASGNPSIKQEGKVDLRGNISQ